MLNNIFMQFGFHLVTNLVYNEYDKLDSGLGEP